MESCLILTSPLAGFCQNAAEEAEHEALRGMKAAFEEAVNNNQMAAFAPYLDEDFSVVTFTDREFTDFEAFKARWQQTRDEMLQGGAYSVELLPERSQIIGDIAITRGDSKNTMTTGSGEEFTFTAHWTAVCRKTDGKWKILRGHNSLDPFGNPMLRSGVKKLAIKMGAGAAAGGLLLGLVIGIAIGRRKRSA